MQSFSARNRRKTFHKSHTSPSLVRNDNYCVDLVGSGKQEPSASVDRLPLPNDDRNPHPVNLARSTKSHRNKLSRLKLVDAHFFSIKMDENELKHYKILKNSHKSLPREAGTLPRQRRRKGSLQLPKSVRILLSPRNPYEEFHKLFTDIPKEELPINDYSCALSRDILLHGRLFVSQNWLCFYSNIFGFETVVKLEFKKVKSIARAKTAYMFPNAILVRTEKKKYLFCSFLMRDAAHRLLSAAWQESTNNKPDSGVDEVSANGDQDEDESENLEEINDETELREMPVDAQQLQPQKDTTSSSLGEHRRTMSCPNTPLSCHPSVDGKPEIGTACLHHKDQHTQKRSSYINSIIRTYSAKIARACSLLLKSTYNWLSPLDWLFRRNKFSAEVFLLLSSFFLILLLISTYLLMARISKLEDRFQNTLPAPSSGQYLITDLQQSEENWSKLLKRYDTRYRHKTQRFNRALKDLLLSFDNVQSKLELIKDELGEPTDVH